MQLRDERIMISALRGGAGWTWPIVLTKSLTQSRSIYRNTRWAQEGGAESDYAKRLSITVALYRVLIPKVGEEKAFDIMRKIMVSSGVAEMQDDLALPGISDKTGMDQLNALWDRFDSRQGVGEVNMGAFVEQSNDVVRYVVTDCFFARFFQEVGAPELTKLLCESDKVFWPQAFPGVEFHRGGSWENAIAYGKDQCVYVFERKQ